MRLRRYRVAPRQYAHQEPQRVAERAGGDDPEQYFGDARERVADAPQRATVGFALLRLVRMARLPARGLSLVAELLRLQHLRDLLPGIFFLRKRAVRSQGRKEAHENHGRDRGITLGDAPQRNLDVPAFEQRAAAEIEPESARDVERLQAQHRDHVAQGAAVAPELAARHALEEVFAGGRRVRRRREELREPAEHQVEHRLEMQADHREPHGIAARAPAEDALALAPGLAGLAFALAHPQGGGAGEVRARV